MKYNIVLKDNNNFILASCKTLELAKKYLEDMKKTDKELQKSYNWSKLPEYQIIEGKEEKGDE
jgi:hypothetical protein